MEQEALDLSALAIGHDRNGQLQMMTPRKDSWTLEEQVRFLDCLATTCNVKLSCRLIGRMAHSAYSKRRSDLEFARLWDETLDTGRAALHTMLLARARGIAEGTAQIEGETVEVTEEIDTELALRLLRQHNDDQGRSRRPGGPPRRRPTREETDKAILKKLEVLGVRIAEGEM